MDKPLFYPRLKDIKYLGKSKNKEDVDFMLKYIHCMMSYSKTPELRAYWTMIYKWIEKQVRSDR